MAGGICKVCHGDAPKKHLFCKKCKTLCSRCRKKPKRGPKSNYCAECSIIVTQFYRKREQKLCPVCSKPVPVGRHAILCSDCKALCSTCRKEPPAQGQKRCRSCIRENNHYLDVLLRNDEEYMAKKRLRMRVLRHIKEGKREREPCAICGAEPGRVFVKRDHNKTLFAFFLCQKHHDEFSGRNGSKPWYR